MEAGFQDPGLGLVVGGLEEAESSPSREGGPSSESAHLVPRDRRKYPPAIWFIIGNEFCERFCYYGMRAILTLYLKYSLSYSEDDATIIYHAFTMACYVLTVLGAIIADSFLGRYRTILYLSIFYSLGSVLISLSAMHIPGLPRETFTLIGLIIIAFGTGGIKPCIAAFGGDQFRLPEQSHLLENYFAFFYLSINVGSLLSTFITPILREDVSCFGDTTCYSLAFGVPVILMAVSILIFLSGRSLYICHPPEGNVILRVVGCMGSALKRKFCGGMYKKQVNHWIEYADPKYSASLLKDIRSVLHVLYLFLPLPVFWALFDQQGSRWTFQATRMNGQLSPYWHIKPDQMQMINPFLILTLIPLCQGYIYPALTKRGWLTKPLQRLTVGGLLAGAAFAVSGILELEIEGSLPSAPPKGTATLMLTNTLTHPIHLDTRAPFCSGLDPRWIGPGETARLSGIQTPSGGTKSCGVTASWNTTGFAVNGTVRLRRQQVWTGWVENDALHQLDLPDNYTISSSGFPKIRFVFELPPGTFERADVRWEGGSLSTPLTASPLQASGYVTLEPYIPHPLFLFLHGEGGGKGVNVSLPHWYGTSGGVYNMLITATPLENGAYEVYSRDLVVTKPFHLHMLWLLPQYVLITMGEVLFSPTGLEFSFTQAPKSMKSVISAAWLLSVGLGNFLIILIAEAALFPQQSAEFFFFAALIVLDMLLFALMARSYKYVEAEALDLPLPPIPTEAAE